MFRNNDKDKFSVEKQNILGAGVMLEPLSQKHLQGLRKVVIENDLWKMKETIIPHPNSLNDYYSASEIAFQKGEELVFAIIDTNTQSIAGCTRFRNINTLHRKAIIGPTFIGSDFQRTHVNTETKYLMLNHAFETWSLNRIELICDVLNVCSRNAITRLGAVEEGIIRNDQVMPDGRIRDSVLHSIIKDDWSHIKNRLEIKKEAFNYHLLSA